MGSPVPNRAVDLDFAARICSGPGPSYGILTLIEKSRILFSERPAGFQILTVKTRWYLLTSPS
jgi:hypothetical protein